VFLWLVVVVREAVGWCCGGCGGVDAGHRLAVRAAADLETHLLHALRECRRWVSSSAAVGAERGLRNLIAVPSALDTVA
jgi:hypothetical protein